MFTIDERIRGLPVNRDQVVALYQSLNAPHLAIPGKPAGMAHAFVLGVRGAGGFSVFIYLYLPDVADCAVYACDRRNLSPDEYAAEEGEAMAFVESMAFMMDNLNFRQLSPDRQDELVRTLPLFQKEPAPLAPPPGAKGAKAEPAKPAASGPLGKLFASF